MSSGALLGASRVRALLDEHGVRPKRSLGQNFVVDPNTIRKTLSAAAVSSGERVLEVGPGVGSLTLGLAAAASSVVAVERDARLIPILQQILAEVDNVEVVHNDALKVDLESYRATALVANLPYNIAATLVLEVLEKAPSIRTLTVMTQREVGERLAAAPGTKSYGATSVLVGFFATARVATTVSRSAFWPVPNVDSVIVRAQRREPFPDVDVSVLFSVVKAAFGQRRKTLRNALSAAVGSVEGAEDALSRAGIDPATRAGSLSLDGYVSLARRLS